MNGLDPNLLNAAITQLRRSGQVKAGFVPSDAAAGAPPPPGGAPPPDPAAGGGAPPPGGDPNAMGGMPPPPPGGDPSMMGGMPPPPPPDPGMMMGGGGGGDMASQIQAGVQNALAQSGLKGNVGPGGKPTAPKPDINTIATDVFQLKKLVLNMFRRQGWEVPQDILDGPNRDPMTGAPALSPGGGSDVQPGSSMMGGAGDQSAIQPIQPMQGAFPAPGGMGGGPGGGGGMPGGDMGKMSAAHDLFTSTVGREIRGDQVLSKAAAVANMCRRRVEVLSEANIPVDHKQTQIQALRLMDAIRR